MTFLRRNGIALLAAGLLCPALLGRSDARAATITVCASGCDHSRIQDAVDATASGDVVLISPGTYRERISIAYDSPDEEPTVKEITLRGGGATPDATVISGDLDGDGLDDGQNIGPVLRAGADEPHMLRFSLENLLITGGEGAAWGGSVWLGGGAPAERFALRNVILTGNRGGALAVYGPCELELSNVVVSGNAPYGGVTLSGVAARLVNCAITLNRHHDAGGAGLSVGGDSRVTLTNTILWGNSAPHSRDLLVRPGAPAGAVTASHSDIGEVYAIDGSYVAGPGVVNVNPVFVNAAAGDLRLHATSPLRDAGTSDDAPDDDLVGRPRPEGAAWDVGAFECQPASAAKLTVFAPNGGERLPTGKPTAITWDAPDDHRAFRVHYSLDNGATWLPINRTALPAGTRHLLWSPPPLGRTRTTCRIRVSALRGYTPVRDSSDRPFTLELVRLMEPNGEEICLFERRPEEDRTRGGTLLGWEFYATSRRIAKVRLSYSFDRGTTWTTIATLGPAGEMKGWDLPDGMVDGMIGLVRVQLLDPLGRVIAADRSDRLIQFRNRYPW